MRRSLALGAVAFLALPLLACSASGSGASPKPGGFIATPDLSGSPVPNDHLERSTVQGTVIAYTAALNGDDPVASFGFNCVADQAAALLIHDLAYWTTGKSDVPDPLSTASRSSVPSSSSAPSPAETYTIETLAETPEHVVPLDIATWPSNDGTPGITTRVQLVREADRWCISYLGNFARQSADDNRAETRDHLAELLADWTAKNPTRAVPPAVMDAQTKATTFYIDKTTNFPLAVARGNRVVLTSTAPAAAGTGRFCFAVTNIGATNPVKTVVFNSAKDGIQPAGAIC